MGLLDIKRDSAIMPPSNKAPMGDCSRGPIQFLNEDLFKEAYLRIFGINKLARYFQHLTPAKVMYSNFGPESQKGW